MTIPFLRSVLVLGLVVTTFGNAVIASGMRPAMATQQFAITGSMSSGMMMSLGGVSSVEQAWPMIKPSGVPAVYGQALGVSYDDPVTSINIMRQYDPYQNPEVMSGTVLDRYIRIALMISCEYCCGADTMVFSNGVAACGCAHSMAMRGLTRYLLEAYPDMTDEQILAELVHWKALYFPKDSAKKALSLSKVGPINLDTYLINNVK